MEKTKNPFESVMKLMKILVKKLEKNGKGNPAELVKPQELIKRGFTADDIAAALQCLALIKTPALENDAIATLGAALPEVKPNLLRQLHNCESIRLSRDAQEMLLSLLNTAQITPVHFERVIDYIWQNDIRDVSLFKLQMILDVSNPFSQNRSGFAISDRVPRPMFLN